MKLVGSDSVQLQHFKVRMKAGSKITEREFTHDFSEKEEVNVWTLVWPHIDRPELTDRPKKLTKRKLGDGTEIQVLPRGESYCLKVSTVDASVCISGVATDDYVLDDEVLRPQRMLEMPPHTDSESETVPQAEEGTKDTFTWAI